MRLLSAKYGLIFLLLIFGSFPGFAQKLTLSGEWHFAVTRTKPVFHNTGTTDRTSL